MNESARRMADIRAMQSSDVPAVLAIQQGSSGAAVWTAADYAKASDQGWLAAVVEEQGSVVAFLVARAQAGELEILNMAVAPNHRRSGVGSRLLAGALEFGRVQGAKTAFLEVRASNRGAIAFYGHHGFLQSGRRRGYYASPVEDAVLLACGLY